jgi:hypothetical protein
MNTFNVGCTDDAAISEKKKKIWPRRTMLLKNAALPPVLPLRSNLILFPYINRIVCVSRARNAQPKIGHPIQSHTTGTKTAWTSASEPYKDLFFARNDSGGWPAAFSWQLSPTDRAEITVRQRLGPWRVCRRLRDSDLVPIACVCSPDAKAIRFMAQHPPSAGRTPSSLGLGFPCCWLTEVIREAGTTALYIPAPARALHEKSPTKTRN